MRARGVDPAHPGAGALVRLFHVSKSYLAGSWALRDVSVELPPGFRVLHAPSGLELSGEGWSYASSFRAEPGRLRFESVWQRDTFRVEPEGYPAYKAMRDARAREALGWIVVERSR